MMGKEYCYQMKGQRPLIIDKAIFISVEKKRRLIDKAIFISVETKKEDDY
jgi:hypothetical protein